MPSSILLPNNIINGRRTFDQVEVPANQNRGDIWRERNSSNDLIETWFWNGNYYLSLQTLKLILKSFGGTTLGDTIQTGTPRHNLFFVNSFANVKISTTNNATNYRFFDISYRNSNNVQTLITSLNTSTGLPNKFSFYSQTLDLHHNTTVTDSAIFLGIGGTIGSPGVAEGEWGLIYRLARA